jgi:hypothetical protein
MLKNVMLWIIVAAFLLTVTSGATADTIIGKCRFKGPPLNKSTIVGTLQVYYEGDVKVREIRGGVNIWKGKGSVWVIRGRRKDVTSNKFEVSGTVQTCDKF